MRAKLFAFPLLVGAGFVVALGATNAVQAQVKGKGKGAVNRPAPKVNPGAGARPAPRPSTPTMTRPQARPQTPQARPQNRPSIGQRPQMQGRPPVSRPTTPRPVNPAARPTQPKGGAVTRPTPQPGLGVGRPATRPAQRPTQPAARPPTNSNLRPSVNPNRPNVPATRPGVNAPGTATTLPGRRPGIGERPNLPTTRPGQGGGGVQWGGAGVRPLPQPITPKKGIDPKRPVGPDRPSIAWPNRPARPGAGAGFNRPSVVQRPGINNIGTRNTVINNRINRTNVTNINQRSSYYNNTNVFAGNRGLANRVYDWGGAWYNNYNAWNRWNFPWYHGSWRGHGFDGWGIGSGLGLGLGAWGLYSSAYDFGYTPYYNPFYVVPQTVVVPQYLNYSQPIVSVVQALPESGQEPPPMPQTATDLFNEALADFKAGNYGNALAKTEAAMKDYSQNPVMHEFRALVLFALGRYQDASAAVYSLLASGPGWDWTTLQSLYPDTDTYLTHLFALEKAAAARPDDAALQFLLAYHYTTANQTEAAKDTLARLRKLLPTDPLVAQLAQTAGVVAEKPVTQPEVSVPADVELDITGDWSAARPDGGKIGLGIKPDGNFAWSVTDKAGKTDSFDGTFTLEDNLLILERKTGGALMGRVTALANNKFQFKVLGGGDADPGLTFTK